jgi:hypothetical protein
VSDDTSDDPRSQDAPEIDSPYPEVRSAVDPSDDPTLRTSTPRAWFLGLLFSILLPGVSQMLFFHWPNTQIQGIVAQLVAHPLGLTLAGLPTRGVWQWVNQREWNVKEHTLVRQSSQKLGG